MENQKGQEISVIEIGREEFDTAIEGENYYILYSWGKNDTPFHGLDLRGH